MTTKVFYNLSEHQADTTSSSSNKDPVTLLDGVTLLGEGKGGKTDGRPRNTVFRVNTLWYDTDTEKGGNEILGERVAGRSEDGGTEGDVKLDVGRRRALDEGADSILSDSVGEFLGIETTSVV